MHEVMRLANTDAEHTIVIGDRWILISWSENRVGAVTVLVLTGIAKEEDLKTAARIISLQLLSGLSLRCFEAF